MCVCVTYTGAVIKLGAVANGVMLEEPFLYIRDASKRVFVCESKVKSSSNKVVGTCEGAAGNVRHMLVYKNVLITCAEGDTSVRVWSAEDGTAFAVLKGSLLLVLCVEPSSRVADVSCSDSSHGHGQWRGAVWHRRGA